jgi:acyl-CoA thioesterase FadM
MPEPAMVRPYRVRFEEATPDETVRTAQLLAWFADCAWQHSASLGCDRAWYQGQGFFLLVRAMRVELLRPIATYAEVNVSTTVVGWRRVSARRESEVRDAAGQLLARGEIDWVTINDRGIPTRWPPGFLARFGGPTEPFEMHKVALPVPTADVHEARFHVRRRELDPLDHVNNSVYLDYFEEALEHAGRADLLTSMPRAYTLEFVGSAERRNALVGRMWPAEGNWFYSLRREDGAELLRARMEAGR